MGRPEVTANTDDMNDDLPAFVPSTSASAESPYRAPRRPLASATFLTSIPSLVVGGFLVVAISVSRLRGDEDEWGIGPFFLGVGVVLLTLTAAATATAMRGKSAERKTTERSIWSIVGLGLAITAAVPSVLILALVR